ncbi:copper chaperone PCu(A)C [Streptomyces ureilyticus]|uniref:Copper chaperone PCu(A)C n=1 Tax=Streptomyces ureilyticus TaxID=1775131 RepID=A0ABX0DMR8_9ACTN|nr:copper chaperone PCu(A)C [Streptomyces ureilyticus]NGO42832.1 copper chaperone PCu(A)C [Streptomyces ureilyticus]
MSSSLRRGALAAAAIAFSIASLAACGAGSNAQSLEIRPDNAATSVGDIQIQNAVVITQPDPESTGPSAISATLFNNGNSDETLESIRVAGVKDPVTLRPAEGSGPITVPADGSVILGGKGNASAVLNGGREALEDGEAQQVTFTFSETGAVKLRAFVVPSEGYYAEWGPSETPQAPGSEGSGSPSPSGSPSATPNEPGNGEAGTDGTGQGSPTDAASPSATPTAPEGGGDAAAGH